MTAPITSGAMTAPGPPPGAGVVGGGVPRLARVLVRLKIRLIVNRARSTRGGWFGLMLSLVAGGAAAVAALAISLGLGTTASPRVRDAILVLAPNVLVVAWAILPLATFGADETLDPSRLVLFPLRRRELVRGLLVASFVGPAPLVAVSATVGVAAGFAVGRARPVALVAAALVLVMAIGVSRAIATTLAAALSSRRWRDAAVVGGSLLAVSLQGIRFLRVPALSFAAVDHLVAVARWTPPGLAGQAAVDAGRGDWVVAGLRLVPVLLTVPVVLWWWGRSLDRALTTVASGATPVRARRGPHAADDRRPLALLPSWLRLPASPIGAVAARELRYSWRDPRRKSALVVRTLLAVGGPAWLLVQSSDPSPRLVLVAGGVGYLAVLGSFNQFGLDGGALWSDLVAGDRIRTLLVGKNLASLVLVVPAVVVAATILAAGTGGWWYLPVTVVVAVGAVAVGLGVADVVSVRFPFPAPEGRGAFGGGALGGGGAGGGGQGILVGVALFGASLVQNLLMAPVVVATGIVAVTVPAGLAVVAPLSLLYGIVIWRAAVRMAVDHAWWREPELIAAVDPERSSRTTR